MTHKNALNAPVAYVYVLWDPDIKKRGYLGVTTKKPEQRKKEHLGEAKQSSRNNKRLNWLRKLQRERKDPVLEVVGYLNPEFMFEQEPYWIMMYEAAGYDLLNATEGGEGNNQPRSDKTKRLSREGSWIRTFMPTTRWELAHFAGVECQKKGGGNVSKLTQEERVNRAKKGWENRRARGLGYGVNSKDDREKFSIANKKFWNSAEGKIVSKQRSKKGGETKKQLSHRWIHPTFASLAYMFGEMRCAKGAEYHMSESEWQEYRKLEW